MNYILGAFLLSIQIVIATPLSVFAIDSKTILIHEIQTGGLNELLQENGRDEFIELHNVSNELVDATGLKLQYFSATREDVNDVQAAPTRELGLIDRHIQPKGYVLFSFENFIENADYYFGQGSTATSGLLARSGGHIRILKDGIVLDTVAWGTAKTPETKALAEIAPGKSVQRKVVDDKTTDSDNNFDDFIVLDQPTPQGGSLVEPVVEIEPEPVIPVCDGLIISELLPNPDGTDSGKEFIELYNPTLGVIFLEDCILRLENSSTQYVFTIGSTINPGEYKAFYDNMTGITLPNAAGGTVTLVGTSSEYSVEYPGNLEADHSWSFIDQAWHDSNQASPHALNMRSLPLPQQVLRDSIEEPESCGAGRYRNPETNRCRNIQTIAAISECAVGQIRNPETNRCRTVASTVAGLIPCREGQERNPETNRCRTNVSIQNTECQAGYERNPETNRCRKTQAVLAASPSVGTGDPSSGEQGLNSIFLITMSALVLAYGVYEYKRDIMNLVEKYKLRQLAKHAVK